MNNLKKKKKKKKKKDRGRKYNLKVLSIFLVKKKIYKSMKFLEESFYLFKKKKKKIQ